MIKLQLMIYFFNSIFSWFSINSTLHLNFIFAVRQNCVHVIVSNRRMLIGNPYRIYRPQVRRCREWSQVKCQYTADEYTELVFSFTVPSFMTHINSCHRRIGHVGALQFEFRVQKKRNGESHVDGGTHIHETSAHIEENLLRNKRNYCEIDSLAFFRCSLFTYE